MVERPLGAAGARHGPHPVRRRRHLRLRHALFPARPHGRFRRDQSPLILGHEIAGEIVEIAAPAPPACSVGDQVAVNPSRWCGHCARCREGRENLCENIYFMGSASKTPHMQGGFASLLRRAARPMREGVAQQTCPVGRGPRRTPCRLPARRRRAGAIEGRRGIVVRRRADRAPHDAGGATCRHDGVAVVDVAAAPLAFAKRLGADDVIDISAGDEPPWPSLRRSRPFDVAFEVSGTAAGLASAIGMFAAAARWCRSVTFRAGTCPCRRTPSWPGKSTSRAPFRFGTGV